MIEARIGLQAALNGDRTKDEHAAVPVSVEELARDAAACVAAGARAIHLHPRDPEGRETLEAGVVDEVVREVRGAVRCARPPPPMAVRYDRTLGAHRLPTGRDGRGEQGPPGLSLAFTWPFRGL